MSAMTYIQKALNVVRRIDQKSEIDIRLDTLALITSTANDIVKDFRKRKQKKPAALSKVRPLPIPKTPAAPVRNPNTQSPSEPKPFTEPERIEK